ncbi:MAG: hypothetical protein M1818_002633 [Claussenomyces sp. TS43310]|nr:MAG: hypothetical protein M1818_002633 [Claussenomyces sp. TS43310]
MSLRNIASLGIASLLSLQISAAPIVISVTLPACSSEAAGPTSSGYSDATLPVNGGPTELPLPLSNLTLKYIALGRGYQNYTCASPSSIPAAVGAVAALFDITSTVFTRNSSAYKFTATAVNLSLPAGTSPLDITAPLQLPGISELFPVLGHHYFTAAGTPTFNLSAAANSLILFGKKIADVKAPVSASLGPAGTGAVDWLDLTAKNGSVGLGQVYRVLTAGGDPPVTCAGQPADGQGVGIVTIDYAAQYWFFG